MVEMMFFITNKNNRTGDFVWGENIKNQIDNKNFYFPLYESPEIALFLSPFYEKNNDFLIWEAIGEGDMIDEKIRKKFSIVETKKIKEIKPIEVYQRINMAILCSLTVVKNEDYYKCCVDYLNQKETFPKTIKKKLEKIECESEEINAAFPVLSSFEEFTNKEALTAAAIFRSFHDALDFDFSLKLDKISLISTRLKTSEIISILEK